MAAPPDRVRIEGLREVRAALRAISREAPREVRVALKPIAEAIAAQTRSRMPSRTGRARRAVTARATQTGAAVAIGGATAEYGQWLDFGGTTKVPGRGNRVSREVVRGGRYLFPTITENRDATEDAAVAAVLDLARRHNIDVRG